ncbi:MAG: ferrous iron transporter B [Firmicutes bacterium]|nr:ferrous iron transporter B [Bacillota bacterium]
MAARVLALYDEAVEGALQRIIPLLKGRYHLSKRSVALLLLQGDPEIAWLVEKQEEAAEKIKGIVAETQAQYTCPLSYHLALALQNRAEELARRSFHVAAGKQQDRQEWLNKFLINAWTGVPVLLVVLYFGLYKFVGQFGAGTLVGFLEGTVFEQHINPWVDSLVVAFIPWPELRALLAQDYGVITLGLRYAIALILPIVSTFFFFFAFIEDSGYLPRLALLVDRIFKPLGLTGRAVIPMVLGFGCDTMATIVTRTLETVRERVISTLLLALAVPCSAQLGVILAILAGRPHALLLWAVLVFLAFLLVGYLAAKILPGEEPSFYMELPPLRWPQLGNVLRKTWTRLQWYFLEVLPMFIFVSVLIWLGNLAGLFPLLIRALSLPVRWLGLPPEAAQVFLFGFFRRDYGAAGLYDIYQAGLLDGVQLVTAAVTLTLFVPCIAQFLVMARERGWKTALAIALFIFPFAFLVGFLLHYFLVSLGVRL